MGASTEPVILGCTIDGAPLLAARPRIVTTQAFILCCECRKPLRSTGGPRQGILCKSCHEHHRTPLQEPWKFLIDGLPKFLNPGEEWGFLESSKVLVRTNENIIHLAQLRQSMWEGVPDAEPEWVLDGRDAYTFELSRTNAWCPTPRWD